MESIASTPLVNSSLLPSHAGKTVKVVGKVEKKTAQSLAIYTSDQGIVEVILTPNSVTPEVNTFVEVVGKVDDHGERLREFHSISLGQQLDLNLVEQCTQLQFKFPELFTSNA